MHDLTTLEVLRSIPGYPIVLTGPVMRHDHERFASTHIQLSSLCFEMSLEYALPGRKSKNLHQQSLQRMLVSSGTERLPGLL